MSNLDQTTRVWIKTTLFHNGYLQVNQDLVVHNLQADADGQPWSTIIIIQAHAMRLYSGFLWFFLLYTGAFTCTCILFFYGSSFFTLPTILHRVLLLLLLTQANIACVLFLLNSYPAEHRQGLVFVVFLLYPAKHRQGLVFVVFLLSFFLSFFCHSFWLITPGCLDEFWPYLVTTYTLTATCHVTSMGPKVT